MSEHTRVDEFLTSLLAICKPLESFEMPLLDAHGATLAADIYAGRGDRAGGSALLHNHSG